MTLRPKSLPWNKWCSQDHFSLVSDHILLKKKKIMWEGWESVQIIIKMMHFQDFPGFELTEVEGQSK